MNLSGRFIFLRADLLLHVVVSCTSFWSLSFYAFPVEDRRHEGPARRARATLLPLGARERDVGSHARHRPEHRSCAVGQCLSVADSLTVTGRQDVRMSFMLASMKRWPCQLVIDSSLRMSDPFRSRLVGDRGAISRVQSAFYSRSSRTSPLSPSAPEGIRRVGRFYAAALRAAAQATMSRSPTRRTCERPGPASSSGRRR